MSRIRMYLRLFIGILCLQGIQVITKSSLLYGQAPSRDNFVFAFENNFEDNQLGNYVLSEWRSDWNQSSYATPEPTVDIDILSENSSKYMRGFLEGGKYQPANHGWSWNCNLKQKYKEIYISHDIRFKSGFEWVIGGKMPLGVSGGPIASGVAANENSGWTVRNMWKEDGQLVFYVYHQNRTTQYGTTLPCGTFKFISGKWYNLTIRVVLNRFSNGVAQDDGILEGFVDGKIVFQKSNFKFRSVETIEIDNLILSAFFGGNTPEWASTRDEWIDTDNYVAYYYSSNPTNVPRGNQLHSSGSMLLHPYKSFTGSNTTTNNLPAPPTEFVSPAQSSSTIDLKWKDNSTREKGFALYRSSSESTGYLEVASYAANVTACIDKSLQSGSTYYYKIRSFNDDGYSAFTPVLKVSTKLADTPILTGNHAPVIANQQFTIYESDFDSNLGRVISSDLDEGQSITYSILSGNPDEIFSINEETGQLSATNEVFGSGISNYTLVIQVSDNGSTPQKSTATITITAIGNSKVVYIDPKNTDDLSENGSVNHPYDSWSDIIWKEGFSYLQKSGTSAIVDMLQIGSNNVTIASYGEGSKPIISSSTTTYMICGFEKSGIHIKNLVLEAVNSSSCVYFLGSTSDSIIIENCILTASSNAIKAVDVATLVACYNNISSGQEGIFSTAYKNNIYYNIFNACSTAVNIGNKSAKAEIYNNVFDDNMQSIFNASDVLTLFNNIFYMEDSHQTALNHRNGTLISDNNIFYPAQTGFISVDGKLFNSLDEIQKELKVDFKSFTTDPQFVDKHNKDYSLCATSPAINSGRNVSILKHDFNGNKVPLFSIIDIGAYEFNGNLAKNIQSTEVAQAGMKVFPNPSNGLINVEAWLNSENPRSEPGVNLQELSVFDITGKNILTKRINLSKDTPYQDKIDLTGFNNGLYFVVIQVDDQLIRQKVLINK